MSKRSKRGQKSPKGRESAFNGRESEEETLPDVLFLPHIKSYEHLKHHENNRGSSTSYAPSIYAAFEKLGVRIELDNDQRGILIHFSEEDKKDRALLEEKQKKVRTAFGYIENAFKNRKPQKLVRLDKWTAPSKPRKPKSCENASASKSKLLFDIPRINHRGKIVVNTNSGPKTLWEPTSNQKSLIESILDPAIRAIILQGPSGAGKTLWPVYAMLILLEEGQIGKIYIEKPQEVVGGKKKAFLPGDMDKKTQPYYATLRDKFGEVLGKGNSAEGVACYDQLVKKGKIERYDAEYKRGDSIDNAALLITEAQNWTIDEFYNGLIRPRGNGKIILEGDGEFQVDLADRSQSGLAVSFEMYAGAPGVRFHTFGSEDIRREDGYTRGIYLARKRWEEAKAQKPKFPAEHFNGNSNGKTHYSYANRAFGNGFHRNGHASSVDDFGEGLGLT